MKANKKVNCCRFNISRRRENEKETQREKSLNHVIEKPNDRQITK